MNSRYLGGKHVPATLHGPKASHNPPPSPPTPEWVPVLYMNQFAARWARVAMTMRQLARCTGKAQFLELAQEGFDNARLRQMTTNHWDTVSNSRGGNREE